MANAIFSNDEENQPIQPEESESRKVNSTNNDDSGTPDDPLPPLGVLLIPGEAGNPSPVTLFPSTEEIVPVESPNMNAFKAPYELTNDGVHLSIPVAPAAIPIRTDFNLMYDDGADSDGEVGPFFDAVEGEDEFDSDDDIEIEHWDPEPLAPNNNILETTVQTTEQQLMLLSNSELKAELRNRNLSTSGNKTVLVQRLLTAATPITEPTFAMHPPPPEQNTTETPPTEATGNPPPASSGTEVPMG
jgi:hypothetical protein